MQNRTGFANGTLSPCIFWERASDFFVILAPVEKDGDLRNARRVFDLKFRHQWRWCEARTLNELDALQRRMVNQEMARLERIHQVNCASRDRLRKVTGDALRQRMVSSATTPFERDWISAYLKLRDDKRDKHRETLFHHNWFIRAREMDSKTLLPVEMDS